VIVNVIQGNDLVITDEDVAGGSSDPFAMVWLAPREEIEPKEHEIKSTKVCPETLNPVWNSKFCFDWKERLALHVRAMDYDVDSAPDYMGDVILPLSLNQTIEEKSFELQVIFLIFWRRFTNIVNDMMS
jgi:Ca2+-dependent lipid-binding protein